jgi:hypothetical protein
MRGEREMREVLVLLWLRCAIDPFVAAVRVVLGIIVNVILRKVFEKFSSTNVSTVFDSIQS